jgi:hypothetical protein
MSIPDSEPPGDKNPPPKLPPAPPSGGIPAPSGTPPANGLLGAVYGTEAEAISRQIDVRHAHEAARWHGMSLWRVWHDDHDPELAMYAALARVDTAGAAPAAPDDAAPLPDGATVQDAVSAVMESRLQMVEWFAHEHLDYDLTDRERTIIAAGGTLCPARRGRQPHNRIARTLNAQMHRALCGRPDERQQARGRHRRRRRQLLDDLLVLCQRRPDLVRRMLRLAEEGGDSGQ